MKTGLVMVISPHPDDAEIGCGGTLCGARMHPSALVQNVILTAGDVRMVHSNTRVPWPVRSAESKAASETLGWQEPTYGGFKDCALNMVESGSLVAYIEEQIDHFKPSSLYIPAPSYDEDHKATYAACLAAVRPGRFASGEISHVFAYEYPNMSNSGLTGSVYVALTSTQLECKVKAVNRYVSQVAGREDTLAGSEGVVALARLRGLECGRKFAEKFTLIKARV